MNPVNYFENLGRRCRSQSRSKSFTAASYFVGLLIQRFAHLLLIPVLVMQFSSQDFSRYGLLLSFLLLAPVVLTLRVHTALGRLIYDKHPQQKTILLGTSLISGVVPVLVATLLSFGLSLLLPFQDPITNGQPWMLLAIGIMLTTRVITEFGSILYRSEGDGPRFLLLSLIEGGLFLMVCLWVLASQISSFEFLVVGMSFASLATGLLGWTMLHLGIQQWRFQWSMLHECFNYSWPTAVHVLGWWFCSQSARWIGISQVGLSTMAGFSLVLVIINVIGLMTRTIFELERPIVGQAFSSNDFLSGNRVLSRCRRDAVLLACVLSIVVTAMYQFCGRLLPEEYRLTLPMLVFISVYLVTDALSLKPTNLLLAMKRSKALSAASLTGGLTSLMTAWLLCWLFGVTGLCLSLFLAVLVQAAISEWISRKLFEESRQKINPLTA